MKRKSITIYTVLISIIFLFCIVFFGYNVFYEYSHGEIRTKKTSEFVTKTIKINGDKTNFNHLFENKNDYEAILITRNGKIIFSYPDSSVKNLKETSLVKMYSEKIKTENADYEVNLALYVLRPSVIFYYARFTFIAILVATIFSFILIFYYQLSSKKDDIEEKNAFFDENNYDKNLEASGSVELREEAVPEVFSQPEESFRNPVNSSEAAVHTTDSTASPAVSVTSVNSAAPDTSASGSGTDAPAAEVPRDAETQKEEYKVPQAPVTEAELTETTPNEASDLFSSITGFSNQSQLESRLESEIVRAASEEQDISLIIAQISNLDFSSECGKKISNLVLSEVPFRNLVFNYGRDGFALIKKNTSIENAESYSQTLLSKILGVLKETTEAALPCGIGISSRSIRIVSEGRMIKEAEEALKHSFEDGENQITAFHVDIEKYREFLRNQA